LDARLVLTPALPVSHSFFNYIFLDKEAYERGTIEEEILNHELAHVRQKHSIDILVIEALLVLAWFNPFLYLYRKAIRLNHEFLADESVLKTFSNVQSYQLLLLDKAAYGSHLSLTSRFNYLTTKQRLIMMTKTTSDKVAALKKIALLPLLIVSVLFFATKMGAQPTTKAKPPRPQAESTVEGISQDLLKEYRSIVAKYITTDVNGRRNIKKPNEDDWARLETIFKQMSKEQQKDQVIIFMPVFPLSPRSVPTNAQLEAWKDPKMYGLWIDEKRVKNSVINRYSNTDFAHVSVSKLEKNALNYGKHYYQVNLMTEECYQKYKHDRDNEIANKKMSMGFRFEKR
jgi:hypothetical protein